MRSTAGCSWSYLVAQPGLVTANQSLLSCSTVSLSSLLTTKPWYESEEEGLAEIELTDNGSLLSWGTSCQWGVFHLIMRLYDSLCVWVLNDLFLDMIAGCN